MEEISVLLVLVGIFVLVFAGVPIAYSLLLGSFVGFWIVGGPPLALEHFRSSPYLVMSSYTFAVCPLFLFLGTLAGEIGLASAAYFALDKWVGRIRGGLLIATIGAGAFFGAVSGSSMASAALFTKVSLPELESHKFSQSVSTACIATAGTLAMLIPPSLPMVLYCVFTGDSLGKLLIAGIVPGILASIILFMGVVLVGTINPKTMPKADIRFSWRERFSGLLAAWPIALVFLIIMGGIYSGFFTPTEAGGIAAFVVFLLALVRRVGKRTIIRALSDAALMTAQIFLIALGGILFGRVVGFSGLSTLLGEFITTLALPPMAIMGVIVLIYLVLGCLMDPLAMLVLTIPFVYPVALSLGYDGISFGIIFIILLEIGALTPPIGFNVFVVAATANIDTWVVFRGIIPFFLLLLVVLWIIIVFPQIATWLPSLMF